MPLEPLPLVPLVPLMPVLPLEPGDVLALPVPMLVADEPWLDVPVRLPWTPVFWPCPPLRLARQFVKSSENFL